MLCTRVKRSHKHRGQRLIVADLRKHEMAERADIFFRPNPSTDAVWFCAVAKYILDNGLAKMDFVNKWVNNFDEYKKSLEPYTLEYAEKVTGVPAATLVTVANEIAAADGVCILFAMGVTQHCGGSDTATALSNLLLLTGNYMRPGAGAYPLRGHNNVQGASDFGSMPNVFSGYQKVDDPDIRAKFEADWGVTLPTSTGKDNHEMIEAILEGSIKSLYIKGEDTITSDSNANYVGSALEKVEFLIVQDINFSETAMFADLVLPACASLEKEGTFTSTERRIQRIYKAMDPPGESKADWEIIQLIANRMGGNWNYTHPSDVMDEVARLTPLFAGVSLRPPRRLQEPPVARTCRRHRLASALHREIPLPRRQGKVLPHRIHSSERRDQQRLRSSPQQRPPARALRTGQHDLSHRGHQGDNTDQLGRGLARAGCRTRDHNRPLRSGDLAARQGARAGSRL